jgi:CRAL/TRIO domain.
VGGDAAFRKALSAASNKANQLYPNLSGPTFLLNLPTLLGTLVKVFTPLFPEEVRKRLKFEQGPLKDVKELVEISPSGSVEARDLFLKQIDNLMMG